MNIFAVDPDPRLAARALCDTHVVKMLLESCQILSTVHSLHGEWYDSLYQPTHQSHPCTLWAAECSGNYQWLVQHAKGLLKEYEFRYEKDHACEDVLDDLVVLPDSMKSGERTRFALAMPDELKFPPNPIASYRRYYRIHKNVMAHWLRGREEPEWWHDPQYKYPSVSAFKASTDYHG